MSLKVHATRIIGLKKKKMLPLTNQELKAYEDAKICYIWGKYFIKKLFRDINYPKLETIAITQTNIEVQHTAFII